MNGIGLIAFALLILLLLPVVVAAWEGRTVPDMLYAIIAMGGVIMTGIGHGLPAMAWSAVVGLACLLAVAAAITVIRSRWRVRLLLGSHIKLLGAGATWLGASGTVAMLLLTTLLFVLAVTILRVRKTISIRPEFAPVAVLAILIVQVNNIL